MVERRLKNAACDSYRVEEHDQQVMLTSKHRNVKQRGYQRTDGGSHVEPSLLLEALNTFRNPIVLEHFAEAEQDSGCSAVEGAR